MKVFAFLLGFVLLATAQDFRDVAPLGLDGQARLYADFGRGRPDDYTANAIRIRVSTNLNVTTIDSWTNFWTFGANGSFQVIYTNRIRHGITNILHNGSLVFTAGYTNVLTLGTTNGVVFYSYLTNWDSVTIVVGDVSAYIDPALGFAWVHGGDYTNDNMRFGGEHLPRMYSHKDFSVAFWMRVTGPLPTNNSKRFAHVTRQYDDGVPVWGFLWDSRAGATGWYAIVHQAKAKASDPIETLRNIGTLSTGMWHHVGLTYQVATTNLRVYLNGTEAGYLTVSNGLAEHVYWTDPSLGGGIIVPFVGDLGPMSIYPEALDAKQMGVLAQ